MRYLGLGLIALAVIGCNSEHARDRQGASQPTGVAQAEEAPSRSSQMTNTPEARDAARIALRQLDLIEPQLNRVERLYHRGFEGGPWLGSVAEYLPAWASKTNAQFDAATAFLALEVQLSGLPLQPLPARAKADSANEEAIRSLREAIKEHRQTYGEFLGRSAPPKP